jgi:hypothetical protein
VSLLRSGGFEGGEVGFEVIWQFNI